MEQGQAIIVGLASGVGGAAAMVAVFMMSFKGLERSIGTVYAALEGLKARLEEKVDRGEMEKCVARVDGELSRKLERDDCTHCHEELTRDLARGGKQFDELFRLQKESTVAIGAMGTSVQLLAQRLGSLTETMDKVTRVEVRRPDDLPDRRV